MLAALRPAPQVPAGHVGHGRRPGAGATAGLVLALALAAGGLTPACGKSSGSTEPPHIIRLSWITRDQVVDLLALPASPVPPWPYRFEAVFDRLLDGSKIEDGTVDPPRPRADPPVHIEFEGKTADNFTPTVVYASNGPAILVSATPTYPAGRRVHISFDPAGVTSQGGQPLAGLSSVTVDTAPFSVSIGAASGGAAGAPLPRTTSLVLTFNNLPRAEDLPGAVRVSAGGADLPFVLRADTLNPLRWRLAPAPCLELWPAGATLTVTVGVGAADVFGSPLPAPVEAALSVVAGDGDAGADADAGGGASTCDAAAAAASTGE
jgi:hypothetical protein